MAILVKLPIHTPIAVYTWDTVPKFKGYFTRGFFGNTLSQPPNWGPSVILPEAPLLFL